VERGALIVEHDVVRPRHAHDEIDPGRAEQHEQGVHVVLVGLGVIGVADVAAHRQAQQFAAEVVFQPGAHDLLAVVEIFRADEAHHGVHQQGLEMARHGIGARFTGLLVHAVVRIRRQRAALAGFEIHHISAHRAAAQRQRRVARLAQQVQADAEARVGGLGARHRLEDEVDRQAGLDGADLLRDVGEHAALRRDREALDDVVQQAPESGEHRHAVRRRIDPDHCVAGAVHQSVQDGDRDGARIVGGVVGLQAHRHPPRQAERVAKRRHHAAFAGDGDQVLIAHQLADRRHHLGRESGGHGGERLAGRRVAEQPLAELTDGQRGERREGRRVVVIDDQPGDLVAFVRDERFLQKAPQGQIRQHHPGRHALGGALRRHPRQRIARAGRARLGEQVLEIGEGVAD